MFICTCTEEDPPIWMSQVSIAGEDICEYKRVQVADMRGCRVSLAAASRSIHTESHRDGLSSMWNLWAN